MSPQDEYRQKLSERYQDARTEFKGSSGWTKWKNLRPEVRRYIVAGMVVVVVLIVVAAVWGTAGVYPSGE